MSGPDDALDAFLDDVAASGLTLYPHQEEALLEIAAGNNAIVTTPTGSGKSMIALGAHRIAMAAGGRSFYTAPIKALVSEKFFDLSKRLGADHVGMLTGDAAVNASAPVICCTAEILANIALREGRDAPVAQVVMDEFHYYADPDRGWAWQVPLVELTRAQFVLMSATLGDVRRFRDDLVRRTGRQTAVITSAQRPVPLDYDYRHTPVHQTIEDLLAEGKAPLYLVHPSQAQAVERAQSLMSMNVATRAEKDAISESIGNFRFSPGFGRQLSRFVKHGVGVHHAGMLPKYRLLIERLAQEGRLKVVCGTDTLGVGINVPIRTVVLTQLSKYDGTRSRLLTSREFHQIAGRAGRAGYDVAGSVVAQAPEHVIENEQAVAKAGDDPKKKRKIVRSQPPKGFVSWSDETFARLIEAPPEPLTSSFRVSHAMLLNLLDRPGDGCAATRSLLTSNDEPRASQRKHIRRAIHIYRSLTASGVVEQLAEPDDWGRRVRVNLDLQAEFALNQPLSPFLLTAIPALPVSESWELDVLSLVEATLDDPGPVLQAQLQKLRGDTIARLKSEGVEYEARMEALDELEHPKPLREFTYELFDQYRAHHPWTADHNIRPKSVARDLWERAMSFGEYVAHYGITRSEGLLLRYLTDAYKGLVQSVPEAAKTDELVDIMEWLGELVRQVDSSLIDEWERLRNPVDAVEPVAVRPITAHARAFTLLVRNAAFRVVELAARQDWAGLSELGEGSGLGWKASEWRDAFVPYFSEHASIGTGASARSGAFFQLERGRVRQVLDDPDEYREWAVVLDVDEEASTAAGAAVLRVVGVERL